jgi:hypothetical protein
MAKKRKKRPSPAKPAAGSSRPRTTATEGSKGPASDGGFAAGSSTRRSGKAPPKRAPGATHASGGGRAVTSTDGGATRRTATSDERAAAAQQAQNRQARKEEARRQREALRRKMARRRIYRRVAVVGAGVLAVGAIAVFVSSSGGSQLTAEQERLLSQAATASAAAGCEDVVEIPEFPNGQDQAHIGGANGPPVMPELSAYPSTPPVSGPHSGATLPAGIYETPPPIDQVLHSMEHGAAVIWYAADASADELAEIQSFFRQAGEQDHVIVAKYDYPDQGPEGSLPEGAGMALAAWHKVRYCDDVSLPVAFEFVHRFATTPHSEYDGEAPEAGGAI